MTTEIEAKVAAPRWRRAFAPVLLRRVFLPIQILLISIAPACAPRLPKPPPVTPGAEGGETIQRFLAEAPCPQDLASDLEFEMQPSGRREIRLVGSFRAFWPDRVRLQLRFGPFTPIASIAVRADSAFLSLPKLKAYWSGRPAGEEGTNPVAVVSGLLWLLCPGPLVRSIEDPVLDRTQKGWFLKGRLGHGEPHLLASLRLSKGGGGIEGIVLADSQGTVLFSAERSGRIRVGEAVVSERLRIVTGTPPITFKARLMRARGDPGQSPDLFRIAPPPGARRLEERELLDLLYSGGSNP